MIKKSDLEKIINEIKNNSNTNYFIDNYSFYVHI